MHDDIQKKGAEAARNGLSLLNCPYLRGGRDASTHRRTSR